MIIKRSFVMLVLFLLITLPFSLAETFTYDSNGNMIQDVDHHYTYDSFNNLIEVNSTDGTLLEEYTYDDQGNRLTKYEETTNTTTYYFDKNLVRTVNSTGTFDTYYYYDDQGTLLMRKDHDGSVYYYHPDHLGSTTLITNEAGNTVEETKYEPFGKVVEGGSDRYTFTGQELDSSGLMYYGARYYDTNLRQFVQPDTLIANIYDPQNLNRYSYVLNNPYKYVDPEGEFIVNILAQIWPAITYAVRQIPTLVVSFVRREITGASLRKDIFFDNQKEKSEQEQLQKFIDDPNYKVTLVTDVPYWKSPYYSIEKVESKQKSSTISSKTIWKGYNYNPLAKNPADVAKGIDPSQTTYDPETGEESYYVINGKRIYIK